MKQIKRDFKLILFKSYKSCKCYRTEEGEYGEPFIKGLYINDNRFFGHLPKEINLRVEFFPDKIINKEFIDGIIKDKFTKDSFFSIKNYTINTNGNLHYKSIVWYEKLMKNGKYRKYLGNSIEIKQIYIRVDFLAKGLYPEKMLFNLNWKYQPIEPIKTNQLSILDKI